MTTDLTGVVFPLTPGHNSIEDYFYWDEVLSAWTGIKACRPLFVIIWLKSNLRVRCCKMCPIESTLCIYCFSFFPLSIFSIKLRSTAFSKNDNAWGRLMGHATTVPTISTGLKFVFKIRYDYTVEVTNRFKGLELIDTVPEELWVEVHDIAQEAVDQEKEIQKGKSLRGPYNELRKEKTQRAKERRNYILVWMQSSKE